MGALLRGLELDLKVEQETDCISRASRTFEWRATRPLRRHERSGAPRVQKLRPARAESAAGSFAGIPHPGPSAERVALEGGRYPSPRMSPQAAEMQSGYCATFRSRSNTRSDAPIGRGATNSRGGVPTSLPHRPSSVSPTQPGRARGRSPNDFQRRRDRRSAPSGPAARRPRRLGWPP